MKKIFASILALLFVAAFSSCAGKSSGKYKEEKSPKFSNTRQFEEAPDTVKRAAKSVLEALARESEPPSVETIQEDGHNLVSPWIYGKSKDKYVVYDFNGAPKRKLLSVRRKYTYNIVASLAGTQVTLSIEEEIEHVDLKSGAAKGWKRETPDSYAYDRLIRLLREKIRSQ